MERSQINQGRTRSARWQATSKRTSAKAERLWAQEEDQCGEKARRGLAGPLHLFNRPGWRIPHLAQHTGARCAPARNTSALDSVHIENTPKWEGCEPSSLPYQMPSESMAATTMFPLFFLISVCSSQSRCRDTSESTVQTTSHSHRGTPRSRPTSFKHSLASSRASSDKRLPSPFPYTWRPLRWVCTFSGSLPAWLPGATRRSAVVHAFGAFRGMDVISQSNA